MPAEIRVQYQQEDSLPDNERELYPEPHRQLQIDCEESGPIHGQSEHPNMVWEMAIKYVWMQGENRSVDFLARIDCFTREVVGEYLGYHCTSQDVKLALDFTFLDPGVHEISNVRIRSNNGTQFVSMVVELSLSSIHIEHEGLHPATTKEDAHIESFNSILER